MIIESIEKGKRKNARSGVRTHASEENSTLNCRLRPLGHSCFHNIKIKKKNKVTRKKKGIKKKKIGNKVRNKKTKIRKKSIKKIDSKKKIKKKRKISKNKKQ